MTKELLDLLHEALGTFAEQFDAAIVGDDEEQEDTSVDGGDLVEWFADWRLRLREELTKVATTTVVRATP